MMLFWKLHLFFSMFLQSLTLCRPSLFRDIMLTNTVEICLDLNAMLLFRLYDSPLLLKLLKCFSNWWSLFGSILSFLKLIFVFDKVDSN